MRRARLTFDKRVIMQMPVSHHVVRYNVGREYRDLHGIYIVRRYQARMLDRRHADQTCPKSFAIASLSSFVLFLVLIIIRAPVPKVDKQSLTDIRSCPRNCPPVRANKAYGREDFAFFGTKRTCAERERESDSKDLGRDPPPSRFE